MPDDPSDKTEQQERFERIISEVVADELGLETDEEGKVDPDAVDEHAFKEKGARIATRAVAAVLKDLLDRSSLGDDGEQLDPEAASERVKKEFGKAGEKVVKSLSSKLNTLIGVPLDQDGIVDETVLTDKEKFEAFADRLKDVMTSIGEQIEAMRDKIEPIFEAVDERVRETEVAPADGAPEVDADADGEPTADDSDNVIDFADWKERRKNPAFRLGESIQMTLSQFLQNQSGTVDEDGSIKLDIDEGFLSNTLPNLLKNALQNLIPPKIELNLPATASGASEPQSAIDTPPATAAAPATDEEAAESDDEELTVSVNLDFRDLLKGFFGGGGEEESEEVDPG